MATTTDLIQQQFGQSAAAYAVSAVHAGGPDLEAMLEAAKLSGSERVLDMGSGAGHTAMAFARGAADVVGLDMTPEMVGVATDLARQRGLANVRFEIGDVTSLPFEDATFDIVTSRFSAHHYGDPLKAMREARRVLRPGGKLLLVDCIAPEDPALDTFLQTFEFLRDRSHVRDWRASEWVRMFEQAGFAASVAARTVVVLDGADWVKRMQTPPSKVAMLRELFAEATDAQRRAYELREHPWGLSLPVALVVGSV